MLDTLRGSYPAEACDPEVGPPICPAGAAADLETLLADRQRHEALCFSLASDGKAVDCKYDFFNGRSVASALDVSEPRELPDKTLQNFCPAID